MHITEFEAQNFKRLRAVRIRVNGRWVPITGKNGQGKTSVMDGIWATLGGGKALPDEPVRHGEPEGYTRVTFDDGSIVTRYYDAGGDTRMTFESKEGAVFPRAQTALDSRQSPICWDPLAFARMGESGAEGRRRQAEMLRGIVPLDVDIGTLDGLNLRDFEKRADANREADRLRAQAASIVWPADTPAAAPDIGALMTQLTEASERNIAIERRNNERARTRERITELQLEPRAIQAGLDEQLNRIDALARVAVEQTEAEIRRHDDDIGRLEAEIARLRGLNTALQGEVLRGVAERAEQQRVAARANAQGELDEAEAQIARLEAELDAGADEAAETEMVDTRELGARIGRAQQISAHVADRQRHATLIAEAEDFERQAGGFTEAIAARNQAKAAALARAKMPVEGLSYDAAQVFYRDVPFAQASASEKLRVSVAIARALNPKIRVLLLRDGVYLDEDGLKILEAEAGDFQVWIETIAAAEGGFEIVDGAVHGAPAFESTVAPRRRRQKADPGQGGLL